MEDGIAKRMKNLKPAKKGEVRNPNGGRAHNGLKAQLKKLTTKELSDMIELVMTKPVSELQKIAMNPNEISLKVGIASAMVRMINKGDFETLEKMLQRVVGKVKDEVDLNHNGIPQAPPAVMHVYIPSNGSTKEENKK
jgi:hypothetical protein